MSPIMLLDLNPYRTVTRFGCVGFSIYACGFSVSQMRHTRQNQNELHLKRCFFFAKIGIFCKSIVGPLPSVVTVLPCSFSKKHPKSAPNSYSFRVRRLFSVCVRVFCAPSSIILLAYIPAKIKMSFIWKDVFFVKIVAIFPGFIQAYTQPFRSAEE